MWRSRWAALGAGVAVVLGGGGIAFVDAAPDSAEKPVTVFLDEPCRLLHTGKGVGRSTPLQPGETYTVAGTGPSGECDVPADAIGLVTNVTALNATSNTNLRFFPAGGEKPGTSSLNPRPGGAPTPNSVTVGLNDAGQFSIFNAFGTVDVIVDVAAYLIDHHHDDRYYTEGEVDTIIANNPGPVGPKGDPGDQGDPGEKGDQGDPGEDAVSPAQVVWVATSGGDFTLLSTALASISDASAGKPYVIKIAPGVYTETSTVTLKDHVDIEGAGEAVTTITCACGAPSTPIASVIEIENVTTQVRDITVVNTGAAESSVGISLSNVVAGNVTLRNLAVSASGGSLYNVAIRNVASSPTIIGATLDAVGGSQSARAISSQSGSSPWLQDIVVTASGISSVGLFDHGSSSTVTGLTVTATGAGGWGVTSQSSSTTTIRNSVIAGVDGSVYADSSTVNVVNSTLDGAASGTTFVCVGAHTAAFVALDTTCT